ncbi:NUDIX domain-containing protein [Streptoalloteichus hindustanus]|uniref:ADP-ribose pyrophosphatase n=1 Tax=Streptoalloteichus hindustanus TaxID=2017 RepID=A0A1M5LI01_STRHI|nr:NUDIX hydrolase [Streptoalloteichus hindustanus]SHG64540.1 ADP-ribose pyrophosphatase [Streptoalloteichus hindustanus]
MSDVDEAGRHEFRTAASRDAYSGRVLALRVDEVVMPGGRTGTREVVEHPGAVAVVALDPEQRVALIHQYRHPVGRRLWELPAGLLDVPGEDPVGAARRELAEETGLAASSWSVLVDVASSPGFSDECVRVFLATGLSEVDREVHHGSEEADLVLDWVPLDDAVRRALAGEIVNATAVAGLLAARAVRGGAAPARPEDAPWRDRPHRWADRQRG